MNIKDFIKCILFFLLGSLTYQTIKNTIEIKEQKEVIALQTEVILLQQKEIKSQQKLLIKYNE